MHYDISFKDSHAELKPLEALQAIIDYMGETKFAELTAQFRKEMPNLTGDQFAFLVSLAGVQGFPVRVWWNYCRADLLAEIP